MVGEGGRGTAAEALVGSRVGGCKLLAVQGEGGMGVVYRGVHELLDRQVAVKLLRLDASPGADQRLFKEARAAARIAHPNVVQIHDAGRHGELAYIVMEYVEGESLGARLRRVGKLAPREAVAIATGVARGLAAAHALGIVHRDVKPDNLLLARGHVKVVDFGLTKLRDDANEITRSGTILGTPAYMSPEACDGQEVDARSDLYSLGVTLFAALTGRLPFESRTMAGALVAHVSKAPPRVRSLEPDVSPDLDALVDRLLAKTPAARPQSALELVEPLVAIAAELRGGESSGSLRSPLATEDTVDLPPPGPAPDGRLGVDETHADLRPPSPGALGATRTIVAARPAPEPDLSVEELLLRAQLFYARGGLADAEQDLLEVLRRAPGHAAARFVLACVFARAGDPDRALATLAEAVRAGFRDAARIEGANAFEGLRHDPRFRAVLAGIEG